MSKKCTHCQPKTMQTVPLISAECEAVRQHLIIRRLIWINILLSLLLSGNFAWNIYNTYSMQEIKSVNTSEIKNNKEYQLYTINTSNTDKNINAYPKKKNKKKG